MYDIAIDTLIAVCKVLRMLFLLLVLLATNVDQCRDKVITWAEYLIRRDLERKGII